MSLAERKIDKVFNLSLNKLHLLRFFTERREEGGYYGIKEQSLDSMKHRKREREKKKAEAKSPYGLKHKSTETNSYS